MENHDSLIEQEIMEATEPSDLQLPEILKKVFASPYKGAYNLFITRHSNSMLYGIVFMLLFGIISAAMPFLMSRGSIRNDDLSVFMKIGLCAIIFQCFVSLFTFIVNLMAGRLDVGKSILTGGICGLILSLFCIFVYLLSLFTGHGNFSALSILWGSAPGGLNWILLFLIIFALMLIFNVVIQSLRAGNEKDGASFYLSPMIVIFAYYLTAKILEQFIR